MEQDRARFENPGRPGRRIVDQRRDLRVGVDRDEPRAELVALADVDDPGVVFRAFVPGGQQLLKHHGDLDAVGRRQRIELQRMRAARQRRLMRRAGVRPVDRGERAAVLAFPFPDLGRFVGGSIGHGVVLRGGRRVDSPRLIPRGPCRVNPVRRVGAWGRRRGRKIAAGANRSPLSGPSYRPRLPEPFRTGSQFLAGQATWPMERPGNFDVQAPSNAVRAVPARALTT